jgi:hypothetical protein
LASDKQQFKKSVHGSRPKTIIRGFSITANLPRKTFIVNLINDFTHQKVVRKD